MAFKFVALFALIAVAAAVPVAYQSTPVLVKQYASAPVYAAKQVEYDAPAEYDFNYAVHDEHTGDVKSQQETRKGDHVVGQYSLIDADGYKRIVDYTADDHSGFNAVVRREPLSGYKQAAPVVQKVYASAPVTKYVSAPVAYSPAPVAYAAAPVAHYSHAVAPVAHYSHGLAPVAQYNHGLAPVAQYNHGLAQVSYSAPAHNYHY